MLSGTLGIPGGNGNKGIWDDVPYGALIIRGADDKTVEGLGTKVFETLETVDFVEIFSEDLFEDVTTNGIGSLGLIITFAPILIGVLLTPVIPNADGRGNVGRVNVEDVEIVDMGKIVTDGEDGVVIVLVVFDTTNSFMESP